MPHIPVASELPGIRALMAFRPETAKPLQDLAETLLRGASPLSRGERELIAAVVSTRNDCTFCASSHAAIAAAQIEGGKDVVEAARRDPTRAPISPKMKALLAIAEQVQRGGKHVKDADVSRARASGATDVEIHDTVLIAAAFCMYNRYVDGLDATTPSDPRAYDAMADMVVKNGYVR
jgi:uncharacterized peroxidase-related enzyme